MRRTSSTLLALSLAGVGCFRQVYIASGTERTYAPTASRWENHLLWGLVNVSGDADLSAICPNGVAQIYSRFNVLNWVVSWITGGIWTPFSVDIWCNVGPRVARDAPPSAARDGARGPVSYRLEVTPSAELLRRWRAFSPALDPALREAGVDLGTLPGASALATRGRAPSM